MSVRAHEAGDAVGPDPQWRYALVVFSGQSDLWWLRLLKPGFRHCFVALSGPGGWVVVDSLSHRTCVAHIPLGPEYDLAGWYRDHGLTVVMAKVISPAKRSAPVMAYSCVESVKRILGIHSGWVLTPWQLFCYVNKTGRYLLTEGVL